jgi:hypothetical protein
MAAAAAIYLRNACVSKKTTRIVGGLDFVGQMMKEARSSSSM